jgi:hypothetical protein
MGGFEMSQRWTLTACALVLAAGLLASGCQTLQERFEPPPPELIYTGTAPGLKEGVLVIDREEDFERAVAPLDPDFAGTRPDLSDFSVLRVVGRERSNACRDTKLTEVSTSGRTATVHLEERVPEAGCRCPEDRLPPEAWLVTVTGWVRRAERQITDIVVPCDELSPRGTGDEVVQLLESTWQRSPGATILQSAEEYRQVLEELGVANRAETVDFDEHRVVAVTGRPRENGCRRTKVVGAELAGAREAVFTLEEIYPAPKQVCTMVFQPPRVFLYRVPASVDRARVVTEERR